ncbi:MAG: hypothetical protein WCL39_02335, partial [Armatimonadota bacterium]
MHITNTPELRILEVPRVLFACLLAALALSAPSMAQTIDAQAEDWAIRFSFLAPFANANINPAKSKLTLPTFTVTPSAAGRQIVRVSLPFPCGSFPRGKGLTVSAGGKPTTPDVRVLTNHPGTPVFVRRAIVTYPFTFPDCKPLSFHLALVPLAEAKPPRAVGKYGGRIGGLGLEVTAGSVRITSDTNSWQADLIAPTRTWSTLAKVEVVEQGKHYLWVRLLVPDAEWPRVIEVRADSLGVIAVRAHLQRRRGKDGGCPDLGWKITGVRPQSVFSNGKVVQVETAPVSHAFGDGQPAWVTAKDLRVSFPDAHLLRRGQLTVSGSEITYLRAKAAERVPLQDSAWREAAIVIGPVSTVPLNALLEPPHKIRIAVQYFDAIYGSGANPDLSKTPELAELYQVHHNWIVQSTMPGDDYGSVTGFPAAGFGMNRLNHCSPIFDEYYRSGDSRLRDTAVQWCGNFHDLSIWWGTNREGEFGGTRY